MAFTYFFRDLQTLEAIGSHVVPALRARRYIKIWDAGCAMGPEPYSLAIMLRERMGATFGNVRIYATDIDESGKFGEIISRGVYSKEQVKRVPNQVLKKYFKECDTPDHFIIAEELRRCVKYQKHDLLSFEPVQTGLGLVLCKNVLLHLKEEERVAVIRMFHEALEAGGFFAVEQTQELPGEVSGLFEPVTANTKLFRKKRVA